MWPFRKKPSPQPQALEEDALPIPPTALVTKATPIEPLPFDESLATLTSLDTLLETTPCSEDAQRYICELLGHFVTPTRIAAAVKQRFQVDISPAGVKSYRLMPKWQLEIQKARDAYLSRQNEVPIYHRMVRLERLERLYQRAATRNNDELAGRQLDRAREEVEKTTPQTVYVHQNIVNLTTEELLQKKQELLAKLQQKEVPDALSEA